jgi:membrane protease YdiL (CAAX protease family)
VLPDGFWKFESLLRLGMLVLMSFSAGIFISYLGAGPAARALHLAPDFVAQVMGFFFMQGLAVAWVSMFVAEHDLTWAEAFGFRRAPGRSVLTACITMLLAWPVAIMVIGMLAALFLNWCGLAPELQVTVSFIKRHPPAWQLVVMAFTAVILAPLAEEALFRGILYTTLKQRGYPRLAWWGNAVLFGIIHVNLTAFLPMVFLGLVWTWLYERTGNLLASIAGHMIFNATSFALLVADNPEWLEKTLNP